MRRPHPSDSPTVLVADEGNPSSRSALAAVRALGAAGHRPLVTVAGRPTLASSSRWAVGTVEVPSDEEGWHKAVVATGLPVLPCSDQACLVLGTPGSELVDKREVGRRAAAVGLGVRGERSFDSSRELVEAQLDYPCVVKPAVRAGEGLDGAVLLRGPADARALRSDAPVVVQPVLSGPMRAVAGVVHQGRLVAAVHQRYERTWPLDCGVASRAVVTAPDRELEGRLLRLLDGLEGLFQVQLIDGVVLDVNPRAYGSLSLAVRAGANLPAIWLSCLAGDPPRDTVRGLPGTRYRWSEGEVRGAWAGRRSALQGAVAAVAQLVPRPGVADGVLDPRDLRPVMRRLAVAAGRS